MARQLLRDPDTDELVTFCLNDAGYPQLHAPGRDHCRACWPPRGRGRGEARYSVRRVQALYRSLDALRLYGFPGSRSGPTYEAVARALGYKTRSGAWRAVQRANQLSLEAHRKQQYQEDLRDITEDFQHEARNAWRRRHYAQQKGKHLD